MARNEEQEVQLKVTDIDALKENAESAVCSFADRWVPSPAFTERCEVMDQGQLRDAMGLRATMDAGDPWPAAEKLLLQRGFCWHWLGGQRVMYLMERDGFIPCTGWEEAEDEG